MSLKYDAGAPQQMQLLLDLSNGASNGNVNPAIVPITQGAVCE